MSSGVMSRLLAKVNIALIRLCKNVHADILNQKAFNLRLVGVRQVSPVPAMGRCALASIALPYKTHAMLLQLTND